MIDRDVLLEALCTVCNADVTVQSDVRLRSAGATQQPQLFSKNFIHAVLGADETSQVSRSNFCRLQCALQGQDPSAGYTYQEECGTRNPPCFINEAEFFDQRFDYDFTKLTAVETYHRGGEVYERPYGWQRFALRVLGDYEDNAWLGTRYRSTQSVPGEWPVSYHGTSKEGAGGIIEGHYKPGPREVYGRGIYSTPYLCEAVDYAKTFTCPANGKTYSVILQNRINPTYREKHRDGKYWLVHVPEGTSKEEEQKMVQRAIRPYGLLLKEV
ncbi:uncharacterized protein LOC119487457 isoform X2 [Sebastes umbrosus]|uniref:uncharacterized protein LOC119487457 isoform X2 n=1 Tax=Sebastes umbrosus TaxID=72105 RepID=UPI00189C9A50|nr:uncharacterized protein LOC119487457 isoform X2 [Sebastes umbrosus]